MGLELGGAVCQSCGSLKTRDPHYLKISTSNEERTALDKALVVVLASGLVDPEAQLGKASVAVVLALVAVVLALALVAQDRAWVVARASVQVDQDKALVAAQEFVVVVASAVGEANDLAVVPGIVVVEEAVAAAVVDLENTASVAVVEEVEQVVAVEEPVVLAQVARHYNCIGVGYCFLSHTQLRRKRLKSRHLRLVLVFSFYVFPLKWPYGRLL